MPFIKNLKLHGVAADVHYMFWDGEPLIAITNFYLQLDHRVKYVPPLEFDRIGPRPPRCIH